MRFANPEWLWLLILWVALGLWAWMRWRSLSKRRTQVADESLWETLDIGPLMLKKTSRRWLWAMLALFFWIVALANPQIGTRMREMQVSNTHLILALDLSQSMMAEDIKPNRLERAKIFMLDVLSQLQTEKVALLLFAGEAYLQSPLTTDYGAIRQMIQGAKPAQVGTQGTQIANVIRLAERVVLPEEASPESPNTKWAMLIASDGENHESLALEAAGEALEKGLSIHTAGVGTAEGAYVPDEQGGVKRDRDGNPVLSQFDPGFLQQLAQTGRGKYYNLSQSSFAAASSIAENLRQGGLNGDTELFVTKASYYQPLILLGLIALGIAWYVGRRNDLRV